MKQICFWNFLAFSLIQQMLTIWSLVPLPFLNPACTSGSSWFTSYWSLVCECYLECYRARMWNEHGCCGSLNILWHCPSLELGWKLNFSSPVATAEFTKFADIEYCTLTKSSFRIWNSSAGIPSPALALFVVMFPKAHLTVESSCV